MKIDVTVKRTYSVTFKIRAFMNAEGGMDEAEYGRAVGTLEEAIMFLEEAKGHDSTIPWMITVSVK